MTSDPDNSPKITAGLPDGWTFHTIDDGYYVTYEVRTEHNFLVMASIWRREWLTDGPSDKDRVG